MAEGTFFMKLIIFGACKNGIKARKIIESNGHSVIAFADNDIAKQHFKLNGLDILSFEGMVELCAKESGGIVIPIRAVDEILEDIFEMKVDQNIKVFIAKTSFFKRDVGCDSMNFDDYFCEIEHWKHRLDYLETHMADHCNLKCKGCGHLSDIAKPAFPDYERFKESLLRLKRLFCGISTIRLMGGEPLLNRELPKFIQCTREIFPDANIRVVSNGLLIPRVEESLFKCMRENDVGFDISLYPPTAKVKTNIEMICLNYDIDVSFSPLIEKFISFKMFDQPHDSQKSYEKCISKRCHFLMDGKLALCGMPILRERKESYNDVINLFDDELDPDEIYKKMKSPCGMCAYCNTDYEYNDWECSGITD